MLTRKKIVGTAWLALLMGLVPANWARAEEAPMVVAGPSGGNPVPDTDRAVELNAKGRYEDAILASRAALVRDERYVPALVALAKSYYFLKKYELVMAILDLARQLEPGNAEVYNILGMTALTRKDATSATAYFKKATELKDDYGNAWNNLAAQYLLAKSYDAALTAAQRATQLLPGFDKAFLNLGSAYRGKGMNVEAEQAYRRALEITPTLTNVYFNLGILYLDAPKIENMDLITQMNAAIDFFARYKNQASFRLTKDDPVDGYIEDARRNIDREQKRLERERKKRERDAAKPAPPPATVAPAPEPAPAPTGPSLDDLGEP